MPPAPNVVRFDHATQRFGEVTALDHLDLHVDRGEIVGLLGPNGAGKTTALRLLLGLISPTEGSASLSGIDAWSDPVGAHRRLAYVPGEFAIWPQLTGGQILDLLGAVSGGYDAEYREELIERFKFDPAKKGRSYSKGNRQKIAVIAALMTRTAARHGRADRRPGPPHGGDVPGVPARGQGQGTGHPVVEPHPLGGRGGL